MIKTIFVKPRSIESKILLFRSCSLDPDINLLFGANGVGKSTLIEGIMSKSVSVEKTGDRELVYLQYVNSKDNHAKKSPNPFDGMNYTDVLVSRFRAKSLSEGQSIVYSITDFFDSIKELDRCDKDYVICIDEIDSGLSADNVNMVCHFIVDLLKERNDLQFIISFNNYHFAYVFKNVLNMYTGKFTKIGSYEEYFKLLADNSQTLFKKRKGNMFSGEILD
jgi:Fe-S cluster assembly ATPase SufC